MTRVLLWLLSVWTLAVYAGNEPALRFEIAGKAIKTVSLGEFRTQLVSRTVRINDPQYQKFKNYQTFALPDLLDFAYGKQWRAQEYSEIAFRAADGYESVASLDKIQQDGGFLAYADLDVPGWEPVGREQANPGPFYLVWSGKQQTTQNAYPWPWQVTAINLIRFAEQYPAVYPRGAATESPAYQGFLIFKARCVRCHAINQQGGKIGPDLQAPKNILDYRDPQTVKAYIREPSQFRYTQMPDHTDLMERDLDNLIAYFKFKQNSGKTP